MQTLVITIATGRTQFLIWERLSLDQTQPTSYSHTAKYLSLLESLIFKKIVALFTN